LRLQDGIVLYGTRRADRRNVMPRSVIIDHQGRAVFEGAFRPAEGGADRDWLRQIIGEIKTRAAASNRLSA
jgi:hypothetical protein